MPRLLSLRGGTPHLFEAANRIGKIALFESLLSLLQRPIGRSGRNLSVPSGEKNQEDQGQD
jgi:hypothetical protein